MDKGENLTKFTVRRAMPDNVHDMVRMRLALQQHMEQSNPRLFRASEAWKQRLPSFYMRHIEDTDSLPLVVLSKQGILAGMALGQLIHDSDLEVSSYVKISGVWVEPAFRRGGLCSLMIEKLVDHYRSKGISTFTLKYVINNAEAESTWKALGFEPVVQSCIISRRPGQP